jgi:hypothetical protein
MLLQCFEAALQKNAAAATGAVMLRLQTDFGGLQRHFSTLHISGFSPPRITALVASAHQTMPNKCGNMHVY